jgi:hypothetical protein
MKIRLIPDAHPHPTTALRCDLGELAKWADQAPSAELTALQAARCQDEVMLLGSRLPVVTGETRFWGSAILIPLGFRLDTSLPEHEIRMAAEIDEAELLVMASEEPEIIPRSSFQPLTRAGVRLAGRDAP